MRLRRKPTPSENVNLITRRSRRALLLSLSAALLLSAPAARAQTLANPDFAQEYRKRAEDALAQQNFKQACEFFEKTYLVSKAIDDALSVAECHYQTNQLLKAYALYQKVYAEARKLELKEAEDSIKKGLAEIAPQLGRIYVESPPNLPQTLILLDGAALSSYPGNNGGYLVQRGTHVLVATADNMFPFVQTFSIHNGGQMVKVKLPPMLGAQEASSQFTASRLIGGLTTAGGVILTIAGAVVLGTSDDSGDEILANNLLYTGLTLGVTSFGFWLTGAPPPEPAKPQTLAISPILTPNVVGGRILATF